MVIPAYNEGRVIGQCLTALADTGLDVEIVVAVNGSDDDTAHVARGFAGVNVLETDTPGKANALNMGDAAATAFPRVFLDADIVLGQGALAAMIDALDVPEPRVAAPRARFDTGGASYLVRQYYEVYKRTPYVTSGLVGLGVYGVSEAGRARFETFPALFADDLFIQRLFAPSERLTTPGWFQVRTPRTVADLVAVRTRVARGNTALAGAADGLPEGDYGASTTSTVKAVAGLVRRRPALAAAAASYVGIVVAGRLAARRDVSGTWHRDDSTR